MLVKNIIRKELTNLVSEGVINQETAARIQEYYDKKRKPQTSILLIAFGILGAILIGSGIILLLAHNWDDIPRWVRTIISVTPLLIAQYLCGYCIIRKSTSIAWRESSATFLFFAIGAGISLISQTYNIYGDFGRFILTWSLLALPAVYLVDSAVAALLYLALVGIWTGYQSIQEHSHPWLYWLLVAALIPYGYRLFKHSAHTNRFTLLSWGGVIFMLATIPFLFSSWEFSHTVLSPTHLLPLVYMVLLSTFYLIGTTSYYEGKHIATNPSLIAASIGIPLLTLIYTYETPWEHLLNMVIDFTVFTTMHGMASLLLLTSLIAFAVFLMVQHIRAGRKYAIPMGAAHFVFIVGYMLALNGIPYIVTQALFNFALFSLAITIIVHGARKTQLAQVNYGMALLSILIMCRFFDSDLSFVTRGIIFIAIGMCFFLINYFIAKKGQKYET